MTSFSFASIQYHQVKQNISTGDMWKLAVCDMKGQTWGNPTQILWRHVSFSEARRFDKLQDSPAGSRNKCKPTLCRHSATDATASPTNERRARKMPLDEYLLRLGRLRQKIIIPHYFQTRYLNLAIRRHRMISWARSRWQCGFFDLTRSLARLRPSSPWRHWTGKFPTILKSW